MTEKERRAAVMEAMGEASACWTNLAGAGVFLSERAITVVDNLCTQLFADFQLELNAVRLELLELQDKHEAFVRAHNWRSDLDYEQ